MINALLIGRLYKTTSRVLIPRYIICDNVSIFWYSIQSIKNSLRPHIFTKQLENNIGASENVYLTKEGNFGASGNFNVWPKVGLWGVTANMLLQTTIELYVSQFPGTIKEKE